MTYTGGRFLGGSAVKQASWSRCIPRRSEFADCVRSVRARVTVVLSPTGHAPQATRGHTPKYEAVW
jgi:hypothetical protein